MTTLHIINDPKHGTIMGADVNSETLRYSLESLPALIGDHDLRALLAALDVGEFDYRECPAHERGKLVATIIHRRAAERLAERRSASPSVFEGF